MTISIEEKRVALLKELIQRSPFPDDEALEGSMTQEKVEEYLGALDRILIELEPLGDRSCLVPLLRSFGLGIGFEVYQHIMHACERLIPLFPSKNDFYDILRNELKTGQPGSRQWICLMIGSNRDARDSKLMLNIALTDPILEVRYEAFLALSMIGDRSIIPQLMPLLQDPNEATRQMATETIRDIQHKNVGDDNEHN